MPSNRLAAPVAIDDLLLWRLSRLLRQAGGMVIRLCEGRFGITRREWSLLALLAAGEGLAPSRLAERAQLDRARTSRAITSLVAKKLVRREPLAGDRRQVRLALTPAGWALHAELFPLVRELNRELLSVLDAQEIGRLDASLDRLQVQALRMLAQVQPALPKADRRRGSRRAGASG